jgi:hypothetical protein
MEMKNPLWLGLMLLLALAACKKQESIYVDEDQIQGELALERTTDVELLYSDSARLRVRIIGPVMLNHTKRSQERQEFTDGIEVEFFDENERLNSRLTAKYAMRYDFDGKVVVRDSVVWRSVEDQMIESSELIWDERNQVIYTNKFSVITTPTDTVFTQYFRANQDFSRITMTSTDGSLIVKDFSAAEPEADL